ncbi:MAG: sulfate ABC transporter substrate-binding protein [Calothrix sp. MO_192.B10]|nr:sulfate ABC transporter substrate-binding protein [Calothrix sp. MO_192.B10]MDJ0734706.1 sulfate ABC transporter substrate-binding protein [Nostocaceae cyanobacterium]
MSWWQKAIKALGVRKRVISLFLVGVSCSVAMAACSGNNISNSGGNIPNATLVAANKKDVELTIASFIVTRNAYKAIIPKFTEKWKLEHNQTVRINQSYGGSGAQTRAVIDGLPADVVHLSMALDTKNIEKAGLIESGWEKEFPNNSIVSKSVVALVTRDGNPKNINTWADLAKEGVQLITADPKTSGVARWNFLALWNAGMKIGGDEIKAVDYVTKAYQNAPILSRDAREATDAFLKQEQGDALINYENEIILAQQKGLKAKYIVPDVNISIDNPITIVDSNVSRHGNREVVEAFVKYLFTPEAQAEFAKVGFRPINKTLAQTKELAEKYPKVNNLGQVNDFGGWNAVQNKFFADGAIFDEIRTKINR